MKINFLVIIAIFQLQFLFGQTVRYVSTSGSNSNSGLSELSAYSTIQFAIDQSVNGDSVLVMPGTYTENIIYNGKNIVLTSLFSRTQDTTYISSTIIDGGANGLYSVIRVHNGETSAKLIGFVIQNGLTVTSNGYGAGINIEGSSLFMDHLIIQNNFSPGSPGGIRLYFNSIPSEITNSIIRSNNSGGVGGAIYTWNSNIRIRNCKIYGNIANDISAICFHQGAQSSSNFPIENSLIFNNSSTTRSIYSSDGLSLINSVVADNIGYIGILGNSYIINSIIASQNNIQNGGILTIKNSIIEDGLSSITSQLPQFLIESNNFFSDPYFSDPSVYDYRLKNFSPGIGFGTSSATINGNAYIAPSNDIELQNRPNPFGSNPDIGAYENALGVPSNAPPTLSTVSDINMYEDEPFTISLAGITDGDINSFQSMTITARSSNSSILPDPVVNYIQGDNTGSLVFYPVLNAYGQSEIELLIKDDGGVLNGGLDSLSVTFLVNVLPSNDSPTDIFLSGNSINENSTSVIGIFSTVDVDLSDNYNYTLVNGFGDNDNGLFNIIGNELSNTVNFDFEGQNSFTIRVRSTDDSLAFTEKVFSINVINQNDILISENVTDALCGGSNPSGSISVTIDQFNGNLSYTWTGPNGFSSSGQNITGLDAGDYTLTVTDDFNSQTATITVGVAPVYSGLEVCYVSSDLLTPSKNRIFFKNPGMYNVQYYQILRESSVLGVYDLIGQANASDSSYLDNSSDNASLSYKYEVRSVDSCGNFSGESPFHKTILLQANLGLGNTVNLSWNAYEGTTYSTYAIYRSINGGAFELLISLPTSNTTFNDGAADVSQNTYKYFVAISVNSCDFTKTINQIRSNQKIIGNASFAELDSPQINVYPNPTKGIINMDLPVGLKLKSWCLMDVLGRVVLCEENSTVDISEISPGIYHLEAKLSDGRDVLVKIEKEKN